MGKTLRCWLSFQGGVYELITKPRTENGFLSSGAFIMNSNAFKFEKHTGIKLKPGEVKRVKITFEIED